MKNFKIGCAFPCGATVIVKKTVQFVSLVNQKKETSLFLCEKKTGISFHFFIWLMQTSFSFVVSFLHFVVVLGIGPYTLHVSVFKISRPSIGPTFTFISFNMHIKLN